MSASITAEIWLRAVLQPMAFLAETCGPRLEAEGLLRKIKLRRLRHDDGLLRRRRSSVPRRVQRREAAKAPRASRQRIQSQR
mmetsp:Transcript_84164/g.153754  ORF Transcript_84164/g.153754 Transcript_84164/m.153754 type:complete len:82 (-) Transcript_84164:400-645(-)